MNPWMLGLALCAQIGEPPMLLGEDPADAAQAAPSADDDGSAASENKGAPDEDAADPHTALGDSQAEIVDPAEVPSSTRPTTPAPSMRKPADQRAPPAKTPRAEMPNDSPDDPSTFVPSGLDPLLTFLLQSIVGYLAGAVITSVAFFAIVAMPAVVALVQTALGDLVGKQRGPLLPSLLSAYGGAAVSGALPIALLNGVGIVGFVMFFLTSFGTLPASLSGPALSMFACGLYGTIFALPIAVLTATLGAALGSAIAYILSAEDKRPGDSGFRFPGLLSPAHRPPSAQAPRDPPRDARAIAY